MSIAEEALCQPCRVEEQQRKSKEGEIYVEREGWREIDRKEGAIRGFTID